MLARHPDRVGRPEALRLLLVRELDAERVPAAEILLHAAALPPDEDGHLLDPRISHRFDRVREERLPRHGEERLREVRGERAHPGALPGAQNPRLHAAALTFDRAIS